MRYSSIIVGCVVALIASLTTAYGLDEAQVVKPYKIWSDVQPAELKKFNAPVATRYELANGMVVFLLEDHELPIVDLSMTIRAGEIHEPPDMLGISGATASVMRSGGSAKYPGDKLDEILENMAAGIHVGSGPDSGSASLNTLKEDFDKGLEIFIDVLRNPDFPEAKIDLHREHLKKSISKRNDQPGGIAGREFKKYMYGKDSPYAKVMEYTDVAKITRDSMKAYHAKIYHPNMFILSVVGDFKKEEMLAKLKTAFEPWPKADVTLPAVPPLPTEHVQRTLYAEHPGTNQTIIMMGHMVDIHRDHKDYAAIQMMNEILGGSMSARLFTEVRTKKGLAYSVGGAAQIYFNRPGLFYCQAQTRNEQALETVDAIREEIVKFREKGVTETELAEARESLLNSFVFQFDSPSKIIGRQATYEFYKYPMDFAEKQMENIKKVTLDDVNQAAKKYLDPDKMQLIGVGNTEALTKAKVKSFKTLPGVQVLDVTIPPDPAKKEPLK